MKYSKDQNFTEIGNEVLDIANKKGFPSDTDFLIKRIELEVKEVREAFEQKEDDERLAEETIDVVIQCIQLIKKLGLDPAEVYRNKMDINWQRNWDISKLK